MLYGGQLVFIRVLQGRIEELIGLVEQSVAANPGLQGWRAGLAWAYCWVDRHADALTIIEQAAADRFDHVQWDQLRMNALATYADAASLAGAKDAAAILYELIEPWADQVVWNGLIGNGHARTYLGLLAATVGWDERADEHFAFACEFHEREGMLAWAARAHLGWAEALASRGEMERAEQQATRALELAREHGYGAIEARAAALTGSTTPS
jgi:tetratricopeptide (TPR) repeat protein